MVLDNNVYDIYLAISGDMFPAPEIWYWSDDLENEIRVLKQNDYGDRHWMPLYFI